MISLKRDMDIVSAYTFFPRSLLSLYLKFIFTLTSLFSPSSTPSVTLLEGEDLPSKCATLAEYQTGENNSYLESHQKT